VLIFERIKTPDLIAEELVMRIMDQRWNPIVPFFSAVFAEAFMAQRRCEIVAFFEFTLARYNCMHTRTILNCIPHVIKFLPDNFTRRCRVVLNCEAERFC